MEFTKNLLFVLLVPLTAAVALLLIAGGGDGVWQHQGIHTIAQPRARVFDWLSDPNYRTEWVVDLKTSRSVTRRIDVGSKIEESYTIDGARVKRTYEVVAYEPESVLSLRSQHEGYLLELTYNLSPHMSGQRTRIDLDITVTFEAWWARVGEVILGSRVLDDIEADLEALEAKMGATAY